MRYLSNKEKKELSLILPKEYELEKKDEVTEDSDIIYKNQEKYLIVTRKNKKDILEAIPHLKNAKDGSLPSVYIDIGAIPFLIKGADMMRPGIHKIENFSEGEIVFIKDENHNKILGVGRAVYSSEEMKKQEKGVSVKVLHYVGDEKY